MMKRRDFITLLGGAAAAFSTPAHSQNSPKHLIGHLASASQASATPQYQAFTTDDNATNGVVLILFSIFCFTIAGASFFVAFIAVHIWLVATILLRLCEGKYIRAAVWSCVFAFLVNIDANIWF